MNPFDKLRKAIDEQGIPGDIVTISIEMRQAILEHIGLPKEMWKQYDVDVHVRPRRASLTRPRAKWDAWKDASTGDVLLKRVEGDKVYVRAVHTIHEPAVMTKAEFEARFGSGT